MRICVVAPDVNPPWIEGGSKAIFCLSKMLAHMGNEVHIVTTQPYTSGKRVLESTAELEGVIFHRAKALFSIAPTSKYSPMHVIAHLSLTTKLFSVLREGRFDVLHSYSGASILALRTVLAKKIFKIPSVHTFDAQSYVPILGSPIFFNYLSSLDKVITTTEALYNCLSTKVTSKKLVNIPFGVDMDVFSPAAKSTIREEFGIGDDLLVLYVGHLYQEKGVSYLVKAASLVLKEFPRAKFVLGWSGIGSGLNEVKRLIKNLELDNSFVVTGRRDDLAGVYACSDVFVLPLASEYHTLGHPMTVLESLACGTAIVSTLLPAMSEIIGDGRGGLLVKPKNHMELAEAICKLFASKELRRRLGENGRSIIREKFCQWNTLEQLIEVYKQVREQAEL